MRFSAQPPDLARERLTDELIETYVAWREACACVDHTYAAWCRAGCGERQIAHTVHVAALDREDCAARIHREAVERLGGHPGSASSC